MLRMKPVKDAKKAESYYAKSDGGYYVDGGDGLRREWIGNGAAKLGLTGTPEFGQFKNLINGLDPHTGEQLTARLVDGRIAAWDATASVPKGVTTALERGDTRIQGAIWDSVREAISMMEEYATTRVRVDGQQTDRVTGNLVGYAVEHGETRPVVDESLPEGHPWREMPDWDRHIHVVIANLTNDEVEDKWKAVKFRPIMDIRKYFDRCFDTILAGKLANDLGYEVETSWKDNGKYHSWDIRGIPDRVIKINSRRTAEVDQTEADIIAGMKEHHADAPDHLSAVARDHLGATSRRQKRDDLTLAECREYWNSRITDEEGGQIADTIGRAMRGENLRPENRADLAIDFAFRHHCEKQSVIRWEELAATAMEHSIGAASPADIELAGQRLGLIFAERDGRRVVTNEGLQAEEREIAGLAVGGRGKVAPVGVAAGLDRGGLNREQFDAVTGLLESSNRVNVLLGPAGAGKSKLLGTLDEGMRLAGQNVTYLATTAKAVDVLKKDHFSGTKTLAHFLVDERLQEAARNGRVVLDESSMAGHRDAVKLVRIAKAKNLKLIFVGDPAQHGSVARGSLLKVLTEFGKVEPFRLTKIMRQKDAGYRAAAQLFSEGKTLAGFDALDAKGWVKEIGDDAERYRAVAGAYVQSLAAGKDTLVISPTHAEAAAIGKEIRSQLRAAGRLGGEDHAFRRLVAVDASEAERGLEATYRGKELVIQFHQNAKGGYVKGQRLAVTDPAKVPLSEAGKFQLYRWEAVPIATGEKIRFTGTVKSRDGKATYKNGDIHTVAAISKGGNLRLDDGSLIAADAGHFRPAWVETSFGAQGQTLQRVILGCSSASLGATNQEQMYVSCSRAKEDMVIFTDDKEAIREGMQRSSQKLAALELLPEPPPETKRPDVLGQLRERKRREDHARQLRAAAVPPPQLEQERHYGYGR